MKIKEYDRIVTKYSLLAKTAFLEEQAKPVHDNPTTKIENDISKDKRAKKKNNEDNLKSSSDDSTQPQKFSTWSLYQFTFF